MFLADKMCEIFGARGMGSLGFTWNVYALLLLVGYWGSEKWDEMLLLIQIKIYKK